LSADAPRLLAARSEIGYVSRTAEALPDEPEAVSEDAQAALSRRTTNAAPACEHRTEQLRGVVKRVTLLLRRLDALAAEHDATRELRAATRALERLERRLPARRPAQ